MRSRRLITAALLVLVSAAGACGGDDDGPSGDPFEGTYQVTGQTENDSGCAAEGPAVTPFDPYFQLGIESFFGQRFLGYFHCTDAATCDEEADLFGSFSEKREGNWTGVLSFASYGTYCLMGETIRTLTGDPDAAVEIRSVMSTASDATLTESECMDGDLDVLIEDHRADLVCENLDVLNATAVVE